MIIDKMKEDAVTALKNGNKDKRVFLTAITDDIKKIGQNDPKSYNRPTTDEDAVKVLRNHIISCEENISLLKSSNRDYSKYLMQLELCKSYLPEEITDDAIISTINEIINGQEKSPKLMGKIIPALKQKFGASLDPAKTSLLAKVILSQ